MEGSKRKAAAAPSLSQTDAASQDSGLNADRSKKHKQVETSAPLAGLIKTIRLRPPASTLEELVSDGV